MPEVTECGLCGGTTLVPVLDMGSQPLAERYGTDERYPLVVAECGDCTLLQLTYAADPAQVFPADHPYASGDTAALRDHFAVLAALLDVTPPGLVVDIGANDGTLLEQFGDGVRKVAVEPTRQADKCHSKGIATYQGFFTAGVAAVILTDHGAAEAVTATNVLAHVPDVHDFMRGVTALLGPGGVFVAEVGDAAGITDGLQVDTVYHEHLRYFTTATLCSLLAAHGLQATRVERISTHGGSLRVWASRRPGSLQMRADAAARALHNALGGITDAGHTVYGVGATTRATPLIHYAKIGEFITCVCEQAGSAKIGKTIPGTSIPIVDEAELFLQQPGYALLFAHHLADGIMAKLRDKGYQGRFILPLPGPVIAGA
jgi:hypothetical protein